jgi:phage-related protein
MSAKDRLLENPPPKPVWFIGAARRELMELPPMVRREIGFAIFSAQRGEKHPKAKPLRGFGGASVLEVVEDHDKETYRGVYSVKFDPVVYVLHAFHKKSKQGIATTQQTIALIKQRLRNAEAVHNAPPDGLQRAITEYAAALATHNAHKDAASLTSKKSRRRNP